MQDFLLSIWKVHNFTSFAFLAGAFTMCVSISSTVTSLSQSAALQLHSLSMSLQLTPHLLPISIPPSSSTPVFCSLFSSHFLPIPSIFISPHFSFIYSLWLPPFFLFCIFSHFPSRSTSASFDVIAVSSLESLWYSLPAIFSSPPPPFPIV